MTAQRKHSRTSKNGKTFTAGQGNKLTVEEINQRTQEAVEKGCLLSLLDLGYDMHEASRMIQTELIKKTELQPKDTKYYTGKLMSYKRNNHLELPTVVNEYEIFVKNNFNMSNFSHYVDNMTLLMLDINKEIFELFIANKDKIDKGLFEYKMEEILMTNNIDNFSTKIMEMLMVLFPKNFTIIMSLANYKNMNYNIYKYLKRVTTQDIKNAFERTLKTKIDPARLAIFTMRDMEE